MPMSDKEFQKKYSYYQKIGNENKLKTIWSDFSIDDLNSNFGFVDSIFYEGVSLEVKKEVSHLELWKFAEQLITLTDDWHHCFIESFKPIKDNCFIMCTGS